MSTRSNTSTPAPPVVTLIVNRDHVAVMDTPDEEVMLLLIEHRHAFVADGGPTGYRRVQESVPLGGLDIKGRPWFPAGLLPRVLALLSEKGRRVEVDDQRRRGPRLGLDRDVFAELDDRERALVKAIGRERLGRIEVGVRTTRSRFARRSAARSPRPGSCCPSRRRDRPTDSGLFWNKSWESGSAWSRAA